MSYLYLVGALGSLGRIEMDAAKGEGGGNFLLSMVGRGGEEGTRHAEENGGKRDLKETDKRMREWREKENKVGVR